VATASVRAIAYYLPQFHPIPENDRWWGDGFTEWSNVAKARPLFPGHRQPRLPGELGFYDLRLPEVREAQAALARDHGVQAFCYYHYWFGAGRRLLERPFNEVLRSGEPEFPFCLAWANQTWSGIWHGAPERVLVEQTYPGEDDDRAHFASLTAAFHDQRYLRVDGKPLFLVYRPQELPEPERFVALWRSMAQDAGLPGLFLVGRSPGGFDPCAHGFDGVVSSQVTPPFRSRLQHDRRARWRPDWMLSVATRRTGLFPAVYSYRKWAKYIPSLPDGAGLAFPTVVPGWDNTPRSGRRGTVYHGATPPAFRQQVQRAVDLLAGRPPQRRLLFVQAWNEWGEGDYLEPDREYGRAFLETFRDAVCEERPARLASRTTDLRPVTRP
jgi:lipopolysaccharide biosynthesis protein